LNTPSTPHCRTPTIKDASRSPRTAKTSPTPSVPSSISSTAPGPRGRHSPGPVRHDSPRGTTPRAFVMSRVNVRA
jgi:hypothetical protein